MIAYTQAADVPVLLCHCENKVDEKKEVHNRSKAADTAACQYCLLAGIGIVSVDDDPLVVPFVTMVLSRVTLYALCRVADHELRYFVVKTWNLIVESEALDCLGSMYRLAEWLALKLAPLVHTSGAKKKLEALQRPVAALTSVTSDVSKSSNSKSGSKGRDQRGKTAKQDREHEQVESELLSLLSGRTVTAAFMGTCHLSSSDCAIVYDVMPAPWHYRVGTNLWLKVFQAARAERAAHEAEVLRALDRTGVECVPRLHDVLRFSNGCVGLLMDRCGEPLTKVKDEEQLWDFARNAAGALAGVHAAGWVHGDVKRATSAWMAWEMCGLWTGSLLNEQEHCRKAIQGATAHQRPRATVPATVTSLTCTAWAWHCAISATRWTARRCNLQRGRRCMWCWLSQTPTSAGVQERRQSIFATMVNRPRKGEGMILGTVIVCRTHRAPAWSSSCAAFGVMASAHLLIACECCCSVGLWCGSTHGL